MKGSANTSAKKGKSKGSSGKMGLISGILSGKVLISQPVWQQRKYLALLFVLAVAYISWSYYVELTVIKRQKLEYEVRVKKMGYFEMMDALTRQSVRSKILEEVKSRNIPIEESKTPPKQIGGKK